jgi:N-methylhydantoinase A
LAEPLRIGIDTGGTFTDFVVVRGSRLTHFKLPSTPHNPAEAILAGVSRVLSDEPRPLDIVHGTTVATNALLERKGAQTALITTQGFEDVIEIGRQNRPDIYNLLVTRTEPLVSRELRFGVAERTGPDGSIITPIEDRDVQKAISEISSLGVESVAVCLLFSFANPGHERFVARALDSLRIPVSLSHRILPEYREYERTSTVVINAYLVPIMSRYLNSLARGLASAGSEETAGRAPGANQDEGTKKRKGRNQLPTAQRLLPALRVMQSNGGSVSAFTAAEEPVRAILSGPAGGVVGALRVCARAGMRDIITFDMGGTSTDVALCRGEAQTTNEALVAGLPVAVPVIDIHTVGAGGGSIARLDEAGALRVGPESAGADPGPACYGRGEQVTVTDANLVLGRLGEASLLGGEMKLDEGRARFYLSKLAAEMSRFTSKRVSAEQAALGVIRVANAGMERALRVVSVERGQDPRLFTLVSFGGAGGLHVCELAAALRIPQVFIPGSPGTLSALGVLLGDVVKDYSRTVMTETSGLDLRTIERAFAELEKQARMDLGEEGFDKDRMKFARIAGVRYIGQSFEIDVKWGKNFETAFHSAHRERYGYADRSRPTEIVSLRVRASGITEKPKLRRVPLGEKRAIKPAHTARVYFSKRAIEAAVYRRDDFRPGAKLRGPAIITEYSSTTFVPPGRAVEVDGWLNLLIT